MKEDLRLGKPPRPGDNSSSDVDDPFIMGKDERLGINSLHQPLLIG